MLRKLNNLRGFTIAATDGEIGKVDDFYFEDDSWALRYMVVDTGPWILGRQVLISPIAIDAVDWEAQVLSVHLTKEKVKNSPAIGEAQPVSRQHEIALHDYYGWPGYWYPAPAMTAPMGGMYAVPIPPQVALDEESEKATATEVEEAGDPHLRSLREVINYHIHATDDHIGHVQDFFADENDWRIRYLLVDTRNWLPGRHVLIGTDWVEQIDWAERDVIVKVTKAQVENSPEYDPHAPVTRAYEEHLYANYEMPGYWFM
ncbi:MAG: PRC-barrel domain-containing protein [Caldilineaceae bacterium]